MNKWLERTQRRADDREERQVLDGWRADVSLTLFEDEEDEDEEEEEEEEKDEDDDAEEEDSEHVAALAAQPFSAGFLAKDRSKQSLYKAAASSSWACVSVRA